MAAQPKPSYDDFVRSLKLALQVVKTEGSYQPIVVWGGSQYLVNRSSTALIKAWKTRHGQDSLSPIYGSEIQPTELEIRLEEKSLFESSNAMVIRSFEKTPKLYSAIQSLTSAGPYPNLLIACFASDRLPNKVRKAIQNNTAVSIPCYQPKKSDELAKFAVSLGRKYGLRFDSEALQFLLEVAGQNLFQLENELKKISLFVPDCSTPICKDTIAPILGETKDAHAFELTDHILQGKVSEAQALLLYLLDRGEQPLAILGILSRLCRQALTIDNLRRTSHSSRSIASQLRLPFFVIERYNRFVSKKPSTTLREALLTCQSMDAQLKSRPIDAELQLSRVLCALT